jgi:hypothetical protein
MTDAAAIEAWYRRTEALPAALRGVWTPSQAWLWAWQSAGLALSLARQVTDDRSRAWALGSAIGYLWRAADAADRRRETPKAGRK